MNITLNAAARGISAFETSAKLRIKTVGETTFVRPTDRVSRVNLPKEEFLVDLKAGKAVVEGLEIAEGTYGVTADKYGWFALVPGHTGRGAALKVAA